MGARSVRPSNLEETIVHLTIVFTWVFWLAGALYVVGPLLAVGLALLAVTRRVGLGEATAVRRAQMPLPASVLVWLVAMGVMYIALFVAHADERLGSLQLIKSTFGWAKGWLLLALFPLVGAMLQIRPELIARALGLLALQTLCLVPIFIVAPLIGLPDQLYVSPFQLLGGPGPEFFDVTLYDTDVVTKRHRWRFFAPWSTLAALYAILMLLIAMLERGMFLKSMAIVSAIAVCVMSQSRLSFVAIPASLLVMFVLANWTRPLSWIIFGFGVALLILGSDEIIDLYYDFSDQFRSARAASSLVRDKLATMALHRWQEEAFWFGHGVLERGPRSVHYMLIGSHHTWIGLLYVKGLVGFMAFLVPMLWTAIALLRRVVAHRLARVCLAALVAMFLGTFGDNIEITTYLIWPVLVLFGIALRRRPMSLGLKAKRRVSSPRATWRVAPAPG